MTRVTMKKAGHYHHYSTIIILHYLPFPILISNQTGKNTFANVYQTGKEIITSIGIMGGGQKWSPYNPQYNAFSITRRRPNFFYCRRIQWRKEKKNSKRWPIFLPFLLNVSCTIYAILCLFIFIAQTTFFSFYYVCFY